MLYLSTRGQSSGLSFEEAVFQGLAPDGGLYIPHSIPTITAVDLASWSELTYPQLATSIFRKFIDPAEIPDDHLEALVHRSFATFSTPEVTPVRRLPTTGGRTEDLWVLELFHGPTFAFKDVALQVLGNLFEYFLERRNRGKEGVEQQQQYGITVLGATSGDTGGAAIYGLRGKKNVDVFILHPKGRISPVQEQQMTSVMDPNVHNIAVEGTFDDCQDIVKAAFGDESFRTRFHLAAVNSINWARILAQTSYYFYSYFSIRKQIGGRDAAADAKIQYSVPTGNFGDVLAGYYAVRMGLPIDRLIVATNENDILHRFFQSGTYEKKKHGDLDGEVEQVKMTLSPAMDILVSSNFERLLWYLVRGDGRHVGDANEDDQDSVKRASTAIEGWMKDLKDRGGFTVPEEVHGRSKDLFTSFCTSDHLTADAIRRYHHHQYEPGSRTVVPSDRPVSYTLDPHTAVGVVAAEQILVGSPLTGTTHTLCLATASPGKFPESVLKSINDGGASEEAVRGGFVEVRYEDIAPKGLVDLAGLPKRCMTVETGGDKSVGLRKVMQAVEETVGQKFAK